MGDSHDTEASGKTKIGTEPEEVAATRRLEQVLFPLPTLEEQAQYAPGLLPHLHAQNLTNRLTTRADLGEH
jgi:hypothetical protein